MKLTMGSVDTDDPAYGTAEHAYAITDGRHPGVRDALQWLTYAHLPEKLREFSRPFYRLAVTLITRITTDSPELTTALNAVIAAKDSAMRAGIRHDTGRAGAVPRPQEVVKPPLLASAPREVCPHGIRYNSPTWHTAHGPEVTCPRQAPVGTEPGCGHPGCILDHPHAGPAVLPADSNPS